MGISKILLICFAGIFRLAGQIAPCSNYACDSLVVRAWLDSNNLEEIHVSEVVGFSLLRVDSIYIYNKGVSKFISEIGNLSHLKYLGIQSNLLSELPPEIGVLTSLKHLLLEGNAITELPAEIGQLDSLEVLDMSYNLLTDLPDEIGELKRLQILKLGSNNITSLPAAIGGLASLEILGLFGNYLTYLPAEIGQLTSLVEFQANTNNLEELPAEISQWKSLRILNLNGSTLRFLPPEIGELAHLNTLSLGGNQLDSIPNSLGDLISLKNLTLRGNNLTQLPGELVRLDLENLNVNENKLCHLSEPLEQWVDKYSYDENWRETQLGEGNKQCQDSLSHLEETKERASEYVQITRGVGYVDFLVQNLESDIQGSLYDVLGIKIFSLDFSGGKARWVPATGTDKILILKIKRLQDIFFRKFVW